MVVLETTNKVNNHMRDLLKELIKAKKSKIFNDTEFKKLLKQLKGLNKNNVINWDDGAGEEWAFVCNNNLTIMLNRRIAICFIRGKLDNPYVKLLNQCNCVEVSGFGIKEWYIDLYDLKKYVPEVVWFISNDGINPERFSLDELYFETV